VINLYKKSGTFGPKTSEATIMKRPAIIIFFDGEKQHTIASTFTDELIERPAGRDFLRIVTYQDLRDVVADVAFPKVGEQLTLLIGKQKLEETDIHHAITECYEGAVYYSQGRSHLVERLDLERGTIQLVPRETGYYTEPLIQTDVDILCTSLLSRRKYASLYYGDFLVTRTVTSYVKRHSRYRNVLDRFDLESLLETELETKALFV
jgi:DEAD/DEAH box helicase domain-containing protein